jgi:hypothetical protein
MELKLDLQQPTHEIVRSLEPSKLWLLGLTTGDLDATVVPAMSPYSFWSECECPGDCLRDHDRE